MYPRLILRVCIVFCLGLVCVPAVFANIIITADVSCRTDIENPDINRSDSSKLSIRSDSKSAKSWIKFDISGLDVTNLDTAVLTLSLHDPKSGNRHFDVSYVNDNCLDNIDWEERSLTWNNAPGNNPADLEGLDPDKTTLLGTIEFTDGEPGDSFSIDVLPALESDTDGIVQFVCYNSNGLLNLATHDHAEETWRPFIDVNEGTRALAKRPDPAKGAADVSVMPILSWKPGEYAKGMSPQHRIFFSTDFNDVSQGLGGITQDEAVYAVSDSPLDFSTTYYWRVDEANSVSAWDVGEIWAFTTEPVAYPVAGDNITVTASSAESGDVGPDNTINGSGLNPDTGTHSTTNTDMWVSAVVTDPGEAVSITFEFDNTLRLYDMRIWNSNLTLENTLGYGFKDVIITLSTDGTEWTRLGGDQGVIQFAQAPGNDTYSGQSIALDNVAARYVKLTALSNWSQYFQQYSLGEVQFSAIPMAARMPSPDSGAQNVDPRTAVLSWRAGRGAVQHEVLIGTDADALESAGPVTESRLALDALNLSLDTSYTWQVNEVNEAAEPSTWAGDLWTFGTLGSLVVDDFESYNNLSPDRPFQAWYDGFGYSADDFFPVAYGGNNTGAGVGHDIWNVTSPHFDGTLMETDSTLPGSSQAMPVYYDNSGANGKLTYSQVDYTVNGQDWTAHGIRTLSIAVRGTAGNTGTLYAKINNTLMPNDLAADIALEEWQIWHIDLTSVNTNLTNVQTLSIGIEGAGATGVIYLDDIELTANAAN